MAWLMRFMSLLMGTAFGSFANVCILRLPADESLTGPSSHCPRCKHALRMIDNIPILSYLFLCGRCHFCHNCISVQYPLIEAIMAGLFLFNAWWFSGRVTHMVIADALAFYSVTISIIDYQHRIIPDELSLSLLALGALVAWWNPYLAPSPGLKRLEMSLTALLAGGGGMLSLAWLGEKVFKKEALGGGDIKLVAAFGAFLGWLGLWSSLLFGSLTGALVGVLLIAFHGKKRHDTLPFGPFLCIGALLMLYLPESCFLYFFPIPH